MWLHPTIFSTTWHNLWLRGSLAKFSSKTHLEITDKFFLFKLAQFLLETVASVDACAWVCIRDVDICYSVDPYSCPYL